MLRCVFSPGFTHSVSAQVLQQRPLYAFYPERSRRERGFFLFAKWNRGLRVRHSFDGARRYSPYILSLAAQLSHS